MPRATQTIDAEKAVNSAVKAARAYYTGKKLSDILLEGLEMSRNNKEWMVVLGFTVPMTTREWPVPINPNVKPHRRMYKIFNVDASSGKVRSVMDVDANSGKARSVISEDSP